MRHPRTPCVILAYKQNSIFTYLFIYVAWIGKYTFCLKQSSNHCAGKICATVKCEVPDLTALFTYVDNVLHIFINITRHKQHHNIPPSKAYHLITIILVLYLIIIYYPNSLWGQLSRYCEQVPNTIMCDSDCHWYWFSQFMYQMMFMVFNSKISGVSCGAGTVYPSGATEFTRAFLWGSYCQVFSFLPSALGCHFCLFSFLLPLYCGLSLSYGFWLLLPGT